MSILEDPFQKIIGDLRAPYRAQREWLERRGLLLIAAFFCSGVGAGTWVASLIYDYAQGLGLSLAIVLVGSGGFHLAFLGKPLRFWRMLWRPQTSWISRGLWGIAVFSPSALLYALPYYFAGLPWRPETTLGQVLMTLSLLGALWLLTYKGFVLADSRAIPFWNTPILPPLYLVYGFRGGLAVLFLAGALRGAGVGEAMEMTKLWVVTSSAVLVFFYLWVMYGAGATARRSVLELLRGRASLAFYLGVVVLGQAVPIILGVVGLISPLGLAALGLIGLGSLVGDFYITYSILKVGIYLPIMGGAQGTKGMG